MKDRNQIEQYLTLLFSDVEDSFIEVRPIRGNRVEQKFFPSSSSPPPNAVDFIGSAAGRFHCFVGVCPRSEESGSADAVKQINTIWADVDVKDFPGKAKPSVLLHLKKHAPHQPTAIVDSGNGFHVYWVLEEPYAIGDNRDSVKELIKRYHHSIDADATHDLARILRVPGTTNIKNPDNPVMCEFEEINDVRYTVGQLAEAVKDAPSVTIEKLRKKLPQSVIQRAKKAPEKYQDDRSRNDYYIVHKLAQAGFDQEEIKETFDLFSRRGWDAGHKYSQRGEQYLEHALQDVGEDSRERLDSLMDAISNSNGHFPAEEMQQACRIISHLPPIEREMKQKELQDSLGGQSAVSIKAVREQVKLATEEGTAPDSASACGRELLSRRHYLNVEGNLYVYEGGVFMPDGKRIIKEDIQEVYGDHWTRKRRDDAIDWVKDKTYITVRDLPENQWLINCKNGIYDLSKDELIEHDPDYKFIWQVSAEYNPGAESERLNEFMKEVFYEEDIPVLWEHCGYTLMPWLQLKKFLILLGKGDNGKSVFLSMVEDALGDESVSHETLRTLTGNRFSTHNLFGKLANICADITADKVKHTEILKSLTGGDDIRAEAKFKESYDFENKAKLLFSANKAPVVSEISEAFFNRLHLVRCPNQFPPEKRDPQLVEKLTTEEAKSAWLNKAIQGAKRLIKNSKFSESKQINREVKEYRRAIDSVTEFLHTETQESQESYERFKTIYDAYRDWCSMNGRQPVSSNVFRERAKINPNDLVVDKKEGIEIYQNLKLKTRGSE